MSKLRYEAGANYDDIEENMLTQYTIDEVDISDEDDPVWEEKIVVHDTNPDLRDKIVHLLNEVSQ